MCLKTKVVAVYFHNLNPKGEGSLPKICASRMHSIFHQKKMYITEPLMQPCLSPLAQKKHQIPL